MLKFQLRFIMLKIIEFYSYFSFLFWIMPGMKQKKEINFIDNGKSFYFKTDKNEGPLYKINKYFIFILRYLPILVILNIFDSFSFDFRIEYLFCIIFSLFLTFIIKNKKLKKSNLYISIGISSFIILALGSYLIYVFDIKYFLYILVASLKFTIVIYAIYSIIEDFINNKMYDFYYCKKNKLIFRISKNG